MGGTIGFIVGLTIMVLGLGGLGIALAQMMTHADPNGALISIGGLGAFVVAALVLMIAAR
jgi:hypothetical protein